MSSAKSQREEQKHDCQVRPGQDNFRKAKSQVGSKFRAGNCPSFVNTLLIISTESKRHVCERFSRLGKLR